ncbi:MAG: hypothetical protein EYC70_03815 [Planctomycetota bacterium]|nr:MAG: hypothetical protein EYC70_03815 [Planctomycetota bacterium]
MNPKRLLLVVVILAALAVGVRLLSRAGDRGEVATPVPAAAPLLAGDPEQLRSLSLFHQPAGRFVKIERVSPGAWQVAEPFEDRAEPVVVQGALAALFADDWGPAPADWQARSDAELGLEPPRLVVEARFEDGSVAELRVGAPDLSGDAHAAVRAGQRVRLGVRTVRILSRPQEDWRDKRVVAQPNGLQRIAWEPAEGPGFVLQRRDSKWYLYQPFSAPLSPAARAGVARMLGARTEILPEEHIRDEQIERMRAGDTLVLHGNGPPQVVRLRGGAAWSEGRPFLIPVHPEDFAVLQLAPEELRSPLLLDVERDEIVSLRLRRGADELVFRRQGDGWSGPGGLVIIEGDRARGIPPDPMKPYLEDLVRVLCEARNEPRRPVPDAPPAGDLLLSRALAPVERGGQMILWWPGPDGRSLVAVPGARECVPLEGPSLDTVFDDLQKEMQRRAQQ